HPGTQPLWFADSKLELQIADDGPGPGADPRVRAAMAGTTTIRAKWKEKDGTPAELDVDIERPLGHESLSVVIPWSSKRFQFTTKDQARPATGSLRVGDDELPIGSDGEAAWGVLDVGRGRWPYR